MFGFEERVYTSTSLKVLDESALFWEGLGWGFWCVFNTYKADIAF